EEAHARLMSLDASEGQRHIAVRWFGRLVQSLREELDVAPNDEVRRLYADIVSGRLAHERRGGPPDEAVQAEAVRPEPDEAPRTEERKLVTVLAADLRGGRGGPGGPDPERHPR